MPDIQCHDWPLPYTGRLDARAIAAIDLLVVHCTELPDLAMARAYGERARHPSATGNSGHFYIDRDGGIHRFVAPDRIAHHTHGYNPRSVGVELVNRGRYPAWLDSRQQTMVEPYSDAQIDQLLALIEHLRAIAPRLRWIAGHEDLDRRRVPASDDAGQSVLRKRDPGPLFPWPRVLRTSGLQRFRPS